MINKKSLIISLGILSCVFFGCGNANPLSNRDIGISVEAYDKGNYDDVSNGADVLLKKFHKNTANRFEDSLAREKNLKDTRYGAKSQGSKSKGKEDKNFRKIDYGQVYADSAAAEIAFLEKDEKVKYRSSINKKLEGDCRILFKDVRDSDDGEMAFKLLTLALDAILLGRDVNKTERIVRAFYEEYSEYFKKITGIEIDFQEICDAGGEEIRTDYGSFRVLNGVAMVAMESYFLQGKCTTKTAKDASLNKIFHGDGDAREAQKNEGYKILLGNLEKRISEVALNIVKKASPFLILKTSSLEKKLKENDKVTVYDLKFLFERSSGGNNKLVRFVNCFEKTNKEGDLTLIDSGNHPRFSLESNRLTVKPLESDEKEGGEQEVDVIWGKIMGQTQMSYLESIAKTFNDHVTKANKAKGADPSKVWKMSEVPIKRIKK